MRLSIPLLALVAVWLCSGMSLAQEAPAVTSVCKTVADQVAGPGLYIGVPGDGVVPAKLPELRPIPEVLDDTLLEPVTISMDAGRGFCLVYAFQETPATDASGNSARQFSVMLQSTYEMLEKTSPAGVSILYFGGEPLQQVLGEEEFTRFVAKGARAVSRFSDAEQLKKMNIPVSGKRNSINLFDRVVRKGLFIRTISSREVSSQFAFEYTRITQNADGRLSKMSKHFAGDRAAGRQLITFSVVDPDICFQNGEMGANLMGCITSTLHVIAFTR